MRDEHDGLVDALIDETARSLTHGAPPPALRARIRAEIRRRSGDVRTGRSWLAWRWPLALASAGAMVMVLLMLVPAWFTVERAPDNVARVAPHQVERSAPPAVVAEAPIDAPVSDGSLAGVASAAAVQQLATERSALFVRRQPNTPVEPGMVVSVELIPPDPPPGPSPLEIALIESPMPLLAEVIEIEPLAQ